MSELTMSEVTMSIDDSGVDPLGHDEVADWRESNRIWSEFTPCEHCGAGLRGDGSCPYCERLAGPDLTDSIGDYTPDDPTAGHAETLVRLANVERRSGSGRGLPKETEEDQ